MLSWITNQLYRSSYSFGQRVVSASLVAAISLPLFGCPGKVPDSDQFAGQKDNSSQVDSYKADAGSSDGGIDAKVNPDVPEDVGYDGGLDTKDTYDAGKDSLDSKVLDSGPVDIGEDTLDSTNYDSLDSGIDSLDSGSSDTFDGSPDTGYDSLDGGLDTKDAVDTYDGGQDVPSSDGDGTSYDSGSDVPKLDTSDAKDTYKSLCPTQLVGDCLDGKKAEFACDEKTGKITVKSCDGKNPASDVVGSTKKGGTCEYFDSSKKKCVSDLEILTVEEKKAKLGNVDVVFKWWVGEGNTCGGNKLGTEGFTPNGLNEDCNKNVNGKPLIDDGTGLMSLVTKGIFEAGCNPVKNPNCGNDNPTKLFNMPDFMIDRYLITVAAYMQCVAEQACKDIPTLFKSKGTGDKNITDFFTNLTKYAEFPMPYLTHNDVSNFCNWAGKRMVYEMEWEKAARGIDGRTFPWGNNPPKSNGSGKLANWNKIYGLTEVGKFPAGKSPYGVFDMAGLFKEWIAEVYSSDAYAKMSPNNPIGPLNGGSLRVVRNVGTWFSNASKINHFHTYMRTSQQNDLRNLAVGGRCAMDVK